MAIAHRFTPEQRAQMLKEYEEAKGKPGFVTALAKKWDCHDSLFAYYAARVRKVAVAVATPPAAKKTRAHTPRMHHPQEFRDEVVAYAKKLKNNALAAKEFGVHESSIRGWRKKTESGTSAALVSKRGAPAARPATTAAPVDARGHRIYDLEFKQKVALAARSTSPEQAAKEFGVPSQVVGRWAQGRNMGNKGFPAGVPGKQKRYTPEFKAEVLAAYETLGSKAAAEKFGIPMQTIYGFSYTKSRKGRSKVGTMDLSVINGALHKVNNAPPLKGHAGALIQEFLRRLRASGVDLLDLSLQGDTCTVNYKTTETFDL